jgi:hypothetical protein
MPRGNAVRLGPLQDLGPVDQSADAPMLEAPELHDLGPVEGGSLPPGMQPTGQATPADPTPPKTLVDKAVDHFLGRDTPDDPVPMPRLAATIIGSLGGGLLAADVPTPPTLPGAALKAGLAVAGSAAGAVSGFVAPEGTALLARKLGLINKETQQSLSMPDEQLKAGIEGEAILDLATSGGVGIARIFGRNITRAMTMGRVNPAADDLAETAAKYGVNMLPVQLGANKVLRMFISVFGRMPWLMSPYIKAAKETQDRLLQALKEFPESLAPAAAGSDVAMRAFRAAKTLATDTVDYYDNLKKGMLQKADSTGIKVSTYETVHHAQDALAEIKRISPVTGRGGRPVLSPELATVSKFINDNIVPMAQDTGKAIQYTSQTLTQMDTLRGLVSNMMTKVKSPEALDALKRVENGLNADMLSNARGPQAKDAIQNFLKMDEQRANALNDIFNTATANKFKQFDKEGLLGSGKATTKSMDELVDVITKSENPEAVANLVKLTERDPEALQGVARSVLDQKILSALKSGKEQGARFDVETFADSIGLNNKTSNRYHYMTKLLDAAGGMKMPEMEKMVEVAKQVGSVEIPNYNTFLVRRTAIGGIKAGMNAMIPSVAFASSAGSSFAFGPASLVATGMALMGSRGFASMISNPASARALRTVMSKEVTEGVRRAAWVKTLRLGVRAMQSGTEGVDQELTQAYDNGIKMMTDSFDEYYKQVRGQ